VLRPLTVFGYDDAPHGHMEVTLENVRVPVVEHAARRRTRLRDRAGRLGPGRIHHCMRLIGLAERALELMCEALAATRRVRQADRAQASRRSALPRRAA
jgi:acyl-CoA dehydrogenase